MRGVSKPFSHPCQSVTMATIAKKNCWTHIRQKKQKKSFRVLSSECTENGTCRFEDVRGDLFALIYIASQYVDFVHFSIFLYWTTGQKHALCIYNNFEGYSRSHLDLIPLHWVDLLTLHQWYGLDFPRMTPLSDITRPSINQSQALLSIIRVKSVPQNNFDFEASWK